MSETGKKQAAAGPACGPLPTPAAGGEGEDAGAYPLYLIPQALSREIHARGGTITAITVRRSGRHNYQITIADAASAASPGTATATGTAPTGGSA
jgi:hypothetical protein